MLNDVTVFNIRDYLSAKDDKELGEEELFGLLSEFSCDKNIDVTLAGYFTITIKPITVNANSFSNTMKRKIFSF